MPKITNDQEFKQALTDLSVPQQRLVAALFAENVLGLVNDFRIQNAINVAKNPQAAAEERDSAYKTAKAASVDSFTQCGRDADWAKQAGHFVAEAVVTSVTPETHLAAEDNLAWNAAMHARMARTCETISGGQGTENAESKQQYRILEGFLTT